MRGATAAVGQLVGVKVISIHAPREGRDVSSVGVKCSEIPFQSTRPARGATL